MEMKILDLTHRSGRVGRFGPKLIFCPIFVICLFLPLREGIPTGSVVVIFAAQDRIVMAADSRVNAVGGNRTAAVDRDISCKIVPIDDFVFASTGILAHPTSGVSVASVMRAAAKQGGDLKTKIERFETMILRTYPEVLSRFKTIDPAAYKSNFENKAAIMAAMVQFGADGPVVHLRTFRPVTTSNGDLEFRVETNECLTKCAGLSAYIGEFEAISKYFEANQEALLKKELVDRARLLVETQIKATPQKVGPPIDILQITKDGNQWAARKPKCAN